MTSDTPLQQLLRAVVRFWWVALLGIVLALLAFTFATYTVLGIPAEAPRALALDVQRVDAVADHQQGRALPLVHERQRQDHQAAGLDDARHDRDGRHAAAELDLRQRQRRGRRPAAPGRDREPLPPRVTSDTVIRLRNKLYGRIAGASPPSTRTPSPAPAASARARSRSSRSRARPTRPRTRLDITNQTAQAFKRWFEGRQADRQDQGNR